MAPSGYLWRKSSKVPSYKFGPRKGVMVELMRVFSELGYLVTIHHEEEKCPTHGARYCCSITISKPWENLLCTRSFKIQSRNYPTPEKSELVIFSPDASAEAIVNIVSYETSPFPRFRMDHWWPL